MDSMQAVRLPSRSFSAIVVDTVAKMNLHDASLTCSTCRSMRSCSLVKTEAKNMEIWQKKKGDDVRLSPAGN